MKLRNKNARLNAAQVTADLKKRGNVELDSTVLFLIFSLIAVSTTLQFVFFL